VGRAQGFGDARVRAGVARWESAGVVRGENVGDGNLFVACDAREVVHRGRRDVERWVRQFEGVGE